MSHPIFTTNAIIINIRPDGEDSVIAECLSADLGRIYLHIQGAKKMNNKHRGVVFPFSSVNVNCVSGTRFYRCTGIAERENVYADLRDLSSYRRGLFEQAFDLVERLVPINIPTPEVFAAFETFYHQALRTDSLDQDVYISLLVLQLRILGILGYWNSDWSDEVLHMNGKTFQYVSDNTKSVEKLIQKILSDTQMNARGQV